MGFFSFPIDSSHWLAGCHPGLCSIGLRPVVAVHELVYHRKLYSIGLMAPKYKQGIDKDKTIGLVTHSLLSWDSNSACCLVQDLVIP